MTVFQIIDSYLIHIFSVRGNQSYDTTMRKEQVQRRRWYSLQVTFPPFHYVSWSLLSLSYDQEQLEEQLRWLATVAFSVITEQVFLDVLSLVYSIEVSNAWWLLLLITADESHIPCRKTGLPLDNLHIFPLPT